MDLTTTIGDLLAQALGGTAPSVSAVGPKVGDAVLIRTVTNYYTGRITAMDAATIALDDAAWIADTGGFSDALATGTLSEVEPFPSGCWVSRGVVVDIAPWGHPLPRERK